MAKEEIYILDKNFDNFAVLDTFKSFIWTDRYNEAGDFEIETVANEYYLNIFRQDYYVYFSRSEHLMIIEQLEINSDAEDGNTIKVRGRSLEAILDRRVIWGWKTLNGSFQNGIKTLINENVISPENGRRRFPNFIFEDTNDAHIAELQMVTQYFGDNLYEAIVDACKVLNVGFKVTLNSEKQLVFKLYYSVFHNCDQDENPFVIFSVDYDNLINSNYKSDMVNYKTVALIGGEGDGSEKRFTSYELPSGGGSGYDRREMYTDQQGVTSDLGEEELDSEDYDQLLKSKGSEELAEKIVTEEFEGETMDTSFVYGVDYNLGDVVTLRNEYGKSSISRVAEYTFSKNETEDKSYPKFETVSDDITMIYRNFDPTKKYYPGDRVDYDGVVYEALEEIEPGPFDEDQWKEVRDVKPREVVELLWRNNGTQLDPVDALLDFPYEEYDYVMFVNNFSYIAGSGSSRVELKVRWNVEQMGGDYCHLIPSSWLSILDTKGYKAHDGINMADSDWVSPLATELYSTQGDDLIGIDNNRMLEIYGVGNHKFQDKQKSPKLILGDGWNFNEGNGDLITLHESINNFDLITFLSTTDLDTGSLDPRSGITSFYNRIFPVEFLNEIYSKNAELESQQNIHRYFFDTGNDGQSMAPIDDIHMSHLDRGGNVYNGIFAAYGSKYTKCEKIFGSFERNTIQTDIELSKPFTNYDLLVFITVSNSNIETEDIAFTSSVITVKELEYLLSCYKSGEGLAALSGFEINYTYLVWYQCFKVVSTIKFQYTPLVVTGGRYGDTFAVAEVYGIKY